MNELQYELIRIRKEGITLQAIANKLGVRSRTTIKNWENGDFLPYGLKQKTILQTLKRM